MRERITLHTAPTERAEAEFVVHSIEQIIGGHNLFSIDSGRTATTADNATARTDLSFADFAVLYRTEAQASGLREALTRSGMPFTIYGHEPLAVRREVQDMLDALRELEADPLATTPAGASDARTSVDRTSLVARLTAAAEVAIQRTPERDPALVRAALQHLITLAHRCDREGTDFHDAVLLTTESDLWDPRADRIALLTIHAAKGLEFPIVFMVGLEDGILPLHWGSGAHDDHALAEERRLCYVGMTRAQDRLILSHATQRTWRGRVQTLPPSPFLTDIAGALVEHSAPSVMRRTQTSTQLTLL